MQSWAAAGIPELPGRAGPLRLYDTATGELTEVAPAQGPARMYVCGITPYDATHLGHAATYLTFDLVVRAWRDAGHEVQYTQNVTDVDDPLLERAKQTGEDWVALAERETELFREDMAALRMLPPQHYIGAVEAIPRITELIAALRIEDAVYDVEGDLYFAVKSDPEFGKVSGLDAEAMRALFGERGGDPDRPGKRDPLDALVWQAERPGEPAWDSPFGRGRPGWHVECAAIAIESLGMPVDVQGGGSDLVFPHHEISASHAQVATRRHPFARSYVHQGMVGLDGEKMSKSKGNLVLVSRLRAAGADPMAIRLALLTHHHREDWSWTHDDLHLAEHRLATWRTAVARPSGPPGEPVLAAVREALTTDLDTVSALAAIDAWAAAEGDDPSAPDLVRRTADALLGVST